MGPRSRRIVPRAAADGQHLDRCPDHPLAAHCAPNWRSASLGEEPGCIIHKTSTSKGANSPMTTQTVQGLPGAGPAGRIYNLAAGPAVLPVSVLEQAQSEFFNYGGSGISVMEMSHRSKEFEGIIQGAEADLRALLGVPDDYRVLFLQGGATLQFAMLPMNLRPAGASADYVLTGAWAKAAIKEAEKVGRVRVAGSSEASSFSYIPSPADLQLDPQAAYLHFTSHETIHGVEWAADAEPEPPPGVPLVCDASSDIASHPQDVKKYALTYAGTHKTYRASGVTLVIVR